MLQFNKYTFRLRGATFITFWEETFLHKIFDFICRVCFTRESQDGSLRILKWELKSKSDHACVTSSIFDGYAKRNYIDHRVLFIRGKELQKKNKKIDIARKILRFQFLTMNILTSKKIILFWHSSVYSWASRKSSTRFLWDVIIRRLLVRRLNYTHHEADQC